MAVVFKPPRDLACYSTQLDEGVAAIQLPDTMSPDSFAEFECWVELILRRYRRNADRQRTVAVVSEMSDAEHDAQKQRDHEAALKEIRSSPLDMMSLHGE